MNFTTALSGAELSRLLQSLQHYGASQTETELLDNADLKILFKVTDKTLYRWRQKGYLPFYQMGGKLYYSKQLLMAMLNQRLVNRFL